MENQDKNTDGLKKARNLLTKLYNKSGNAMPICCGVSIVLSISFDLCRQDYWSPALELLFHRRPEEFFDLGAIIFTIWTVSISFIVFFLGFVNDRRYGIKFINIVLVGKNAYAGLVFKAIVFMVELFVMIWAVLYRQEITITVCLIMQIAWMLYFFWLICSTMSEKGLQTKVVEEAIAQFEENGQAGRLLYKMMQNISYEDITEVELLFNIFEKIKETGDEHKESKERFICNLSSKLSGYMLEKVNSRDRALNILGEWLERLEKSGEKYDAHIRYGIVEGIIDHSYEPYCPDMEEVADLAVISSENRRKMIMWALAYCFYGMDKAGRKYKVFVLADELMRLVSPPISEQDGSFLFSIWSSFFEGENMHGECTDINLKRLWKLMAGGSENDS